MCAFITWYRQSIYNKLVYISYRQLLRKHWRGKYQRIFLPHKLSLSYLPTPQKGCLYFSISDVTGLWLYPYWSLEKADPASLDKIFYNDRLYVAVKMHSNFFP